MQLSDISSFSELLKNSNEINASTEKSVKPILKQQHVVSIESDNIMSKYFELSDIIEAFILVTKHYSDAKDQKISWHDTKIVKYLNSIKKYIDQLAAYISIEHENVSVQIDLPPDTFNNNKTLATFIKQSDEWKALRNILKTDLTLINQSLTVRAIGFSILSKTKSFTKIIN